MIRNYVKQYEAWQELDPDEIELEPGTRKPSEKVLDQLFNDIKYNHIQGVKDYISCDYDPDSKDEIGNIPLIYACEHNKIKIAEYLIKNGANVNTKDKYEETPLGWACKKNNIELAKYLVENGADVNAKNNYGNTPLILACERNKIEIAKYLVENGADVNAKNDIGRTPLFYACGQRYTELAKYLIENDANVNAKDKSGETPLIAACRYFHSALAEHLVDNGADVNAKNDLGQTPLILACERADTGLAIFLVDNGAKINVKNRDGETAIDIAIEKGIDIAIEKGEMSLIEFLLSSLEKEDKSEYETYSHNLLFTPEQITEFLEDYCYNCTRGDITSEDGLCGVCNPNEGYVSMKLKAEREDNSYVINCFLPDINDLDWYSFVQDVAENLNTDSSDDEIIDKILENLCDFYLSSYEYETNIDDFRLPISRKVLEEFITEKLRSFQDDLEDRALSCVDEVKECISDKYYLMKDNELYIEDSFSTPEEAEEAMEEAEAELDEDEESDFWVAHGEIVNGKFKYMFYSGRSK